MQLWLGGQQVPRYRVARGYYKYGDKLTILIVRDGVDPRKRSYYIGIYQNLWAKAV